MKKLAIMILMCSVIITFGCGISNSSEDVQGGEVTPAPTAIETATSTATPTPTATSKPTSTPAQQAEESKTPLVLEKSDIAEVSINFLKECYNENLQAAFVSPDLQIMKTDLDADGNSEIWLFVEVYKSFDVLLFEVDKNNTATLLSHESNLEINRNDLLFNTEIYKNDLGKSSVIYFKSVQEDTVSQGKRTVETFYTLNENKLEQNVLLMYELQEKEPVYKAEKANETEISKQEYVSQKEQFLNNSTHSQNAVTVNVKDFENFEENNLQTAIDGMTEAFDELTKSVLEHLEDDQSIFEIFLEDYDNDGEKEAFVSIFDERNSLGNSNIEIWFVNENNFKSIQKMPEEKMSSYSLGTEIPSKMLNIGNRKFFCTYTLLGTSVSTCAYTVENGEVLAFIDFGYFDEKDICDNEINVTVSTLDGEREAKVEIKDGEEPFFQLERTVKKYYLYWDEKNKEIREYGGIEISKEDFLTLNGAEGFLKKAEKRGFEKAVLEKIYYRENGIININYHTGDLKTNEWESVYHINLQVENGKVIEIKAPEDSGYYLPACYPEIATYPSKFS